MSLPVLTAIADPRHEADLASRLHELDGPVTVVRRCVDLPDLLATAAAGIGRAAIISPDLRRFDRSTVDQLAQARVGVVGFAAGSDAERRLEQLGIGRQVSDHTPVEELCAEVLAAVTDLDHDPALERILDWSTGDSGGSMHPRSGPPSGAPPVAAPPIALGRLIAVWGPAGGPGRTSLAVNLAAELARLDREVLLVDADCYGGTVAQTLGLYDEAAGVASACRAVNAGTLDEAALQVLLADVRPRLRVLTGISRADRWTELRPGALRVVLDCARSVAEVVVVDTGFCLEDDEDLSYDTAAPRRNGSTLAVLAAADAVLAVVAGDPLGLTRYVRARPELTTLVGAEAVTTVVNRVRPAVVGGGDAVQQIATALARHAGVPAITAIPDDPASYDAAIAIGRTLVEVAPRSPARLAIRALAADLAGVDRPRSRRGLLRRPRE